ncbi:hypothetical protein NPIL_424361 [Nephila pilipes]|uniref:Uncharacterized protein n=1 Tax=Nephila pilipes TaxID=299642 RepID=A0A8X6Q190_NEPPI|nr:hypothetical protein NPIL_424361 [Nephila pilipes]
MIYLSLPSLHQLSSAILVAYIKTCLSALQRSKSLKGFCTHKRRHDISLRIIISRVCLLLMDSCRERDIQVILEMYLYDRVSSNEISMATVEGLPTVYWITRLPFIISDARKQNKRHFDFTMELFSCRESGLPCSVV